ncbi:HU family DNA-binding protein [Dysgonomonas sp. 521]|uniref:HU family DNA-binding protein n=1 Tax=Dysgonomonas sp. 521 TaxID=2302932 RepID=UPI0013D2F269|nr:HU family DNA-binding protein [Dysgonomonas sp. 521]NDV93716.1 HU family DNA-binding protein [Dysgonomonas sp. 521]
MNERLSLQDLIDLLAKKQEITKKDAETFLRELITVISENIESNEPVKIKDFGTFKLVKVNARRSVDVNTGEAIEIAAHYKLSFVPDKSLKEAINRPFAHFESVVLEEGVSFENIAKAEEVIVEADEEDVSVDDESNEDAAVITPVVSLDMPEGAESVSREEITEDSNIAAVEDTPAVQEEIHEIEASEEEVVEEEITEYISVPESSTVIDYQEDIQPEEDIVGAEEDVVTTPQPLADIPDEGDLEYERKVAERKEALKRRRRLISLGFFIFLILAGFLIGGLYFQEIAKYLTNGPDNNRPVAVVEGKQDIKPSTDVIPADSLSAVQAQDSIPASTSLGSPVQEKDKLPEQPKADATPTPNVNTPLATVKIESGSTLRNIALKYYGHKSFCIYIYEENKAKIKNINNIPLGTKLVVPAPAKYGINAQDRSSIEKAKEKESKLYREMGL